jgi:hypothetical protein
MTYDRFRRSGLARGWVSVATSNPFLHQNDPSRLRHWGYCYLGFSSLVHRRGAGIAYQWVASRVEMTFRTGRTRRSGYRGIPNDEDVQILRFFFFEESWNFHNLKGVSERGYFPFILYELWAAVVGFYSCFPNRLIIRESGQDHDWCKASASLPERSPALT